MGKFLLVAGVVHLLLPAVANADWVRRNEAIMGTAIYVELWHPDQQAGESAIDAVIDEMHRIDRLMSTYKPNSEISQVNDRAATEPVLVSDELKNLILKSLELSELTGGAFDITYASVGHHYDYRERQRPDVATIEKALPAVDYRHVIVDEPNDTVRFAREGVRIDLGGIAKGYAVERGVSILADLGVGKMRLLTNNPRKVVGLDSFGLQLVEQVTVRIQEKRPICRERGTRLGGVHPIVN